jgi:uncharacterized protein (DUF1501 family)
MKRRDFIKRTAPATVLPFLLNGFTLRAYGRTPFLDALLNASQDTDRVFVLIQLSGGNDGLNTVIPLDQYSAYQSARSNIAIAENQVLKLTNETGLHPQMTPLQTKYTENKVRVVQSVGYPTPDFSHFRSTDIWLTASDYDQIIETGWMGRYLAGEFPGFPTGYPNATMPDPLAIQIGSALSTGLEGPLANMGMAFSDPTTYYNIVNGNGGSSPQSRYGQELDYIRSIGRQLEKFATPVRDAASRATNKSTLYPAVRTNPLADQLKIVADLIAGGLKTRIYIVGMGGFDTHSNQNNGGNGTPVPHGTLLNQVSVAIQAFQDDLRLLNVEDRVVGMTFSEFGRRIKSNGSGGTDHGAAAPLFVFGTNVIPGVLGANPTIPTSATANDNIPMQFDFRSVYASILKDWFNVQDSALSSILFKDFQILPIIKTAPSSVREDVAESSLTLHQNYPNPFSGTTRIRFATSGGHVQMQVFDGTGKEVARPVDRVLAAGEHEVTFDAAGFAAGTYYCRIQNGSRQEMKAMAIVR